MLLGSKESNDVAVSSEVCKKARETFVGVKMQLVDGPPVRMQMSFVHEVMWGTSEADQLVALYQQLGVIGEGGGKCTQ